MSQHAVSIEPVVRAWLPPDLVAPSHARKALDGLNHGIAEDLLVRLKLLVSELVTNSVVHPSLSETDRIGLEVSVTPETVRVAVSDAGPGFEPPAGPLHLDGVNGRGLLLVDQLADRWGVDRDPCTLVWFEIERD